MKGGVLIQQRHTPQDFTRYYRTYMEDNVQQIERERHVALQNLAGPKKRTILLLGLYALFSLFILIVTRFGTNFELIIGAVGIYTFSYAIPYEKEKKKVLMQIKEKLIREVIRFLDRGLQYEPENYIHESLFLEANLYNKSSIDRYRGEDYIYGQIGNTSITFSEVHAEDKRKDSKGNTKYVTIFRGLFFEVDFHKPFAGSVYVTRNAGIFSSKPNNNGERLEKINLENPAFQERYLVRASDQILARFILTPLFMERLLEFEQTTGHSVRFSFRDGKMYLAIHTNKDHFDFDLKQTLNQDVLYDYFHEVKIAFDIIEELNLNTNIWK